MCLVVAVVMGCALRVMYILRRERDKRKDEKWLCGGKEGGGRRVRLSFVRKKRRETRT